MKRFAAVFAASLLLSTAAWAATATWTGAFEYVTTVTGRSAVSCQYSLFGETFWKTFVRSSCPYSIEVE